jgi:hypothetical protein
MRTFLRITVKRMFPVFMSICEFGLYKTDQLHEARVSHEMLKSVELVNIFPTFYAAKGSLPCSQEPATCPYLNQMSPAISSTPVSFRSILILSPIYASVFQLVSIIQLVHCYKVSGILTTYHSKQSLHLFWVSDCWHKSMWWIYEHINMTHPTQAIMALSRASARWNNVTQNATKNYTTHPKKLKNRSTFS